MQKQNLFVIGLDDFTRQQLQQLPQAEHCAFHPLLDSDALRDAARCDMAELVHEAVGTLDTFKGSVDGIASDRGFPATCLVPILAERFGLPSAPLDAVLKCEHSYWGRCEQAEAVPEQVPPFQVFDPFDEKGVERLEAMLPCRIRPFEAFRSDLALSLYQAQDLAPALDILRREQGVFSEPFRWLLTNFKLPERIAQRDNSFLAEVLVGGAQCVVEGYVHNGEVCGHVLSDAVCKPRSSTPRATEPRVALAMDSGCRMLDIARAVLNRIGLDNTAFSVELLYNQSSDHIWLRSVTPRIAARPHANRSEQTQGLSPLAVMVELALGRKPVTPASRRPPATVQPSARQQPMRQSERSGGALPAPSMQAGTDVSGSRILVVDDHDQSLTALDAMLVDAQFRVELAADSNQLFVQLRRATPDLILLDIRLPGHDGFEVCERLQADPDTAAIPIIFVTSIHKDAASIARGFAAGGVDFITRPFFPEELIARVQAHLRLTKYRRHLEQLIRIDPLTGLLNRRAMSEQLEAERRRALRTGSPYALLLGDIDLFKRVNDHHGHQCGDSVLMQVARILKGRVRRSEQVCRWGGEEFLLLLPDTNAFGGAVLAEALRSAVVATPFSCEQRSLDITMSFGIMADRGELPLEACINKADAALYAAKQQGRNRCVTHANATGDA
jgi:diguanylate cyclase (GGDEF)-like protein